MTVFEEGKDVKLVFEFNDKWTDLLKFDDAEEVRRRAHLGKSVDFIGVLSLKICYLIEAKHFQEAYLKFDLKKLTGEEPLITKDIIKKVTDSLATISHLAEQSKDEKPYWQRINSFTNQQKSCTVLHLEIEGISPQLSQGIFTITTNILKQKLSQQTPDIIVTNSFINSLAPDLLVRIEK
jgi:hypothetical protein